MGEVNFFSMFRVAKRSQRWCFEGCFFLEILVTHKRTLHKMVPVSGTWYKVVNFKEEKGEGSGKQRCRGIHHVVPSDDHIPSHIHKT